MLTTTLSKPQSMSLGLPDKDPKDDTPPVKVDENRTMTIILGDNNKIVRYVGLLATPVAGGAPKEFTFGKEGIRKELLSRKKSVLEYSTALGKPKNGIIVIIKPTKKSNYRNLVDILDEMVIAGVETYAIVPEFSPEEAKLVSSDSNAPINPNP
jgi:hypothetical protein